MVEVDASTPLIGDRGRVPLLEVFEGRRQLIVYFHMWHDGKPAEDQCEGCTFFNGQVSELSYLHARDVTYATFSEGPYEEAAAYRRFMGYDMPWYSAQESAEALLAGRWFGMLVGYLRDGDRVFETYWAKRPRHRGHGAGLRAARHDGLRPPGAVRGLARGLAAALGEQREPVPHQRPPERAVVTTGRWPVRRSDRAPGALRACTQTGGASSIVGCYDPVSCALLSGVSVESAGAAVACWRSRCSRRSTGRAAK